MTGPFDECKAEMDAILAEAIVPPRQARAREKMEKMLAAGQELLIEKGYEGLRVEDVCARVGAKIMSFHLRFGSKENFFAALQIRYALRTTEAGEQALRAMPRDGVSMRDSVLRAVTLFVAINRANTKVFSGFFRYAGANPLVFRSMIVQNRVARELFHWFLEPHRHKIAHPDPDLALDLAADLVLNLAQMFHTFDPSPIKLADPRLEGIVADAVLRILAGKVPPDV